MSTASISYSSIKNAAGEARDVAKKLDKYADSINSTVYKKLNSYNGSWTSNITSARSKADAKISDLRTQAGKYRDYANELDDLKTECESVDGTVKSKVSSLTASFKAAHGINNNVVVNTISYFFTSIGNSSKAGRWINEKTDQIDTGLDYLKQSIEDWYDYNGGKELVKGIVVAAIEIVVGVLSVVAAVAAILAGGWTVALAAALIGGVIAAVNGFVNLANEIRAHGYADDDPATAKRKSDLNTLQDTLRVETDSEFWHTFATGIDIVNIVCSVISIVDGAGKLIKNGYKWATGNLSSLDDLRVKDILTKDNFKQLFTKLKVTFTQGWDDFSAAMRQGHWEFFGDVLADFGTDFMTNLKNRFAGFKTINVDATNIEKLTAIEKNAKTLKNIFGLGKDFAKDGITISNVLEKIVIPCINVAGITSITFPKDGGQGSFDFSNIKLKDFADLWDIKTKVIDKTCDLFDGGNIDSSVLDKMNTPVDINISIPNIHVPQVNIPVVRAA